MVDILNEESGYKDEYLEGYKKDITPNEQEYADFVFSQEEKIKYRWSIPTKNLLNVRFVIKNSSENQTKRYIFKFIPVKNHFNAKYVVNNFFRRYIASIIFELILIGSSSNAQCVIKSFQLKKY